MMPMTIKAHDCMTRSPVTIRSDEPALKAARLMVNHKISGLPVLDADGRVVGVVTDRDLLRSDERTGRRPRWLEFLEPPQTDRLAAFCNRTVGEVMSTPAVTIGPDLPIEEVVRLMNRHRIKRLPVIEDGKLIGIIARADILNAVARGAIRHAAENAKRQNVEQEKQFWISRTRPLG
jgi:CBS domain-containing protein